MEDLTEKIGLLRDKVDNLLGALQLPMPAAFHVEQMKRELQTLSEELTEIITELEEEEQYASSLEKQQLKAGELD